MLELYHWEPNGPYLKPLIALHEKGLDFTAHYFDALAGAQYKADFPELGLEARINQEGEGPLLIHDGRQISESFFMIAYLDEAFADVPLRPADPLGRARVLAWARFINEIFMPGANTLGCHHFLSGQIAGDGGDAIRSLLDRIPMAFLRDGWKRALTDNYPVALIDDAMRKTGLAVRKIEDALSESDWLVGDHYSLADIDAYAIACALPLLAPEQLKEAPRMQAWLDRVSARPAVINALEAGRAADPRRCFVPGPEHARWG